MNLQNSVITMIIVILIMLTAVFAVRYSKLLFMAQKEYERAKDVISGIVFTFKRDQDRQKTTIDQLTLQTETTQSVAERLTIHFQGLESKLKNLITTVEAIPATYKETIEKVNLIEKNFNTIKENQQTIQKQLVALEEKIQVISKEESSTVISDNSQLGIKLTETERTILRLLTDEGVKTSPQIEAKIGKTREHTARLMKKLWQEGYIERDTHRIPYIYRITESLTKIKIRT